MPVTKHFHDCPAESARSSNMKVFMDTIFKDIFEHAAMDCYVKSMEGVEDLMQDDDKRTRLRELLASVILSPLPHRLHAPGRGGAASGGGGGVEAGLRFG